MKIKLMSALLILLPLMAALSQASSAGESDLTKRVQGFWTEFEQYLISVAPQEEFIIRTSNEHPVHNNWINIRRPDLLELRWNTFKHLEKTHKQTADKILELAPRLPYIKGTSGYVMTSHLQGLDYLLTSLRMLRRSGSKLPVEIFFESPKDYNPRVCEEVFPKLNAKCLILTNVTMNVTINKYQYKVFAMLFSSFENMFFLDADNIAVQNPDDLLTSNPYTQYGMIIWLDFWAETISGAYYDMISRPIPSNLSHYSCEAGQLIISKSKHAQTLLLSVYYNLYGPGHYYRLFSQNGYGEGDKESFYMAADYYNIPYYRLTTNVTQLNFLKQGNYDFLAMIQPNPIQDWKKYMDNEPEINVQPMFIHANFVKLHITNLMKQSSLAIAHDGTLTRIWANKTTMENVFGYDIEKVLWQEIINVSKVLFPELVPQIEQYYRVIIDETEIQPKVVREREAEAKRQQDSENQKALLLKVFGVIVVLAIAATAFFRSKQ